MNQSAFPKPRPVAPHPLDVWLNRKGRANLNAKPLSKTYASHTPSCLSKDDYFRIEANAASKASGFQIAVNQILVTVLSCYCFDQFLIRQAS